MAPGPNPWIVYFVLMASGLGFASFLISPFIARIKGYAPYFWLFAAGPVGLIVLVCLRSANTATTPEELELMQARANTTGAILSGVSFFLVLMLFVPLLVFGSR